MDTTWDGSSAPSSLLAGTGAPEKPKKGAGRGGKGTARSSGDGTGPVYLPALARLALRSDSALRDLHRGNEWVLEIASKAHMEKLQALREHWISVQPKGPGSNLLGGLDQLCWTLACKLAQEFSDVDAHKLERVRLFEQGSACIATFAPLLGHTIKKGPPKDGAWLWKLALCQRSADDRKMGELIAEFGAEGLSLAGKLRLDFAPDSADAKIIRTALGPMWQKGTGGKGKRERLRG